MKVLTWVLVVFSSIGLLGLLFKSYPDSNDLWGMLYAILVIIQGVLVLHHLHNHKL